MNTFANSLKVFLFIHIITCEYTFISQKDNNQNKRRILTHSADQLEQLFDQTAFFRLGIFQADQQYNNYFPQVWDNTETGSIQSALQAFKLLVKGGFNIGNDVTELKFYQLPLTLKILEDIRQCFKNLGGSNYQNYQQQYDVTQLNDIDNVAFNLPYKISQTQKDQIIIHQQELQNRLGANILPYIFQIKRKQIFANTAANRDTKTQWITILFQNYENNLQTIQNYFQQNLENLNAKYIQFIQQKTQDKDDQNDLLQQNLDEQKQQEFLQIKLNKEIQILNILAQLIMDLERMHPYLDYNCRTFAVFLLNKELMRNDMTLSILEDPNDFDFMTLPEIVEQIQNGQNNFQNLCTNGKFHTDDPDDYNMIYNSDFLRDFKQISCATEANIKDDVENVSDEFLKQLINIAENSQDIQDFHSKLPELIKQQTIFGLLYQTFQNQPQIIELLDQKIQNLTQCNVNQNQIINIQELKTLVQTYYQQLKNENNKRRILLRQNQYFSTINLNARNLII